MKRRFIGLLLCIPLGLVIPSMVKSCHRGGDVRNASGNLSDNLLTLVFLIGVPMAIVGLVMLFSGGTKTKR